MYFRRERLPGKDKSSLRYGVAVFIVALVTFVGTVKFSYVWDDPYLIGRLREAFSTGDISGLFTSSFYVKTASAARYYRPVMLASLLGDVVLTDGAPWFSHLVNIFIHALNSTLVFFLFQRVFRNDNGALFGAFLFAVLPVHAGTVAAVYNRAELIALALLWPLVFYWTDSWYSRGPGRARYRAVALLSFFLACLTKEIAFMLPAVLIGWEALRFRRPDPDRLKDLVYTAMIAGAALLLRVVIFAWERAEPAIQGARAGELSQETSLLKVIKVFLIDTRLAVFPFPGRTHWAATDLFIGWTTVAAVVCFFLILGLGFKKAPEQTARGLIWWLAFAVPVVGFINLGPIVATERYIYIPSVGLCMIVGGIVALLPKKMMEARWVRGLALAVLFALGAGSMIQARVWANDVALFGEITESNPGYANAHVNLGVALAREGRYMEALRSYEKAQRLIPGWVDVSFNRGNLFYQMGKYEEALEDFDKVLEAGPADWETLLNRGNVLVALDRYDEAERSYSAALALNPPSGKPLVGLGVLAARDGHYSHAVRLFTDAAQRDPGLTEAYEGMGESYLALGMHGVAEGAYLKVLEIYPGNTRAAMKLGWFQLGVGRPVKAEHAFRRAIAADPSLLEAWVGLVRALDTGGLKRESDDLIRDLEGTDPHLAGRVVESRKSGAAMIDAFDPR